MKSNKIYLIRILEEHEKSQEEQLLTEFADCFEDGDEHNYAVEDVNGLDFIFLRFSDYKIEKVCRVLDRYVKYSVEEISDKIILDSADDIRDIIQNPEYKPFFDSFRIDNTNVDDVLDKINSKGIDSLDDIDKSVLMKA